MSTPPPKPAANELVLLEEAVGYLNFSSGASDPKFLRNVNALFRAIESQCEKKCQTAAVLFGWLEGRMNELSSSASAFGDISQARAVVGLLRDRLLPAYRAFHRDLLWHQPDGQLWRPLFLGRAFEALLAQGGPWNETDRIVAGALETLNDYLGYRPVAVLESERQMEPYAHERVRPIPWYIHDVGVAPGKYEELITRAITILNETDPDIRQQAWFDPQMVEELALDPRAYDFDHPASKRPNHHFGQWDLHYVDNRGYYRRFVLQQITLDSLLSRVDELERENGRGGEGETLSSKRQADTPPLACPATRDELMFEAAAVLAGTILMASGTTGNGPTCHNSDVTLSNLLPRIADYRDQFYESLLSQTGGQHGERLRAEAQRTRQPFGGARQHLNHELARRRAAQMQHVHLAQLYARMGYPDAALAEANGVRIASARMICQIYCLLTAGHQAIDSHQLDAVARELPQIEDLLKRGIECGALVDPWNIVGFGGNFSLFPALENTVRDFRVDDLIELVEQILDLCARAWTEAAAVDDAKHEAVFSAALERLAAWWDKYATASVSGVKRLVGKEIEVSTNLVSGALAAWQKAGAAAGDVKFWRMFVDQFDSPKAFQLVVEALLERGDQVASMALMLQWVSQVETTPLEDGDASFHPLALRWFRAVEHRERETGEDQWPLVAKFLSHLEASAEAYWQVPAFELTSQLCESDELDLEDAEHAGGDDAEDEPPWADEEADERFSAAYEDMVYRDSTDDGFDADIIDEYTDGTEYELEEEAERIAERLDFLTTIARIWRHAAITWTFNGEEVGERRELLDNWRQQATAREERLLELVEVVHRYPIQHPSGSHDSMVEYDRQRMIKDSLLEQIMSTSVETADAARLMLAAAGPSDSSSGDGCQLEAGTPQPGESGAGSASAAVLRGVLHSDAESVARHWPAFTKWLAEQELLYVPLGKGGRPRRIVRARRLGQFLDDLLGWLPRLGMVRETCQLLDIAQSMEANHPVGPGAITEYDRLFARGYQAIVRALIASAEVWDADRDSVAGPLPEASYSRPSDMMLVEALQDLTESQLNRWLTHSRTLRLSVVERLAPDDEWQAFKAFVERYGADLFTQKFLNLGNLRAILHQRTSVWLSNLEQEDTAVGLSEAGFSDSEELRLATELGRAISMEDAAKWLSLAVEAIVENYREYRDYNTTTTHSDHGELLYTLIDFLRLRASYDRVAWNLRPVVMAHEILVRQNRPDAAELWQQALAERTAETADANLARFESLCNQYGVRLPSVAERLGERFTRPLAIDRVRALVGPAIDAAQGQDRTPFAALQQEIASLAQEPAGAGLDLPDWLEALEEEVSMVRCKRRHRQAPDNTPPRIQQVQLTWEEWQQQIADDAS